MKREVKKEHIEFGDHFSRGERTRDCDLSGGFKRKGKGKIRYRERRGRLDSLKKFGGTDARILHYVAFVTNESRLI